MLHLFLNSTFYIEKVTFPFSFFPAPCPVQTALLYAHALRFFHCFEKRSVLSIVFSPCDMRKIPLIPCISNALGVSWKCCFKKEESLPLSVRYYGHAPAPLWIAAAFFTGRFVLRHGGIGRSIRRLQHGCKAAARRALCAPPKASSKRNRNF